MLSTPVESMPKILAKDAVSENIIGYFHANCGGCHNPKASAGKMTGLHLRYDVSILDSNMVPFLETSLNQLTTGFEVPGRTIGTDSFRIEGGSPDFSAIYLRTNTREDHMMPPLGSEVVNREFQKTLYDWIVTQPKAVRTEGL
jgi:hypothetical protein